MNIIVRNPTTGNVYTKFSLPNLSAENVEIVNDGNDFNVIINAHPIESMSKLQDEFNKARYL